MTLEELIKHNTKTSDIQDIDLLSDKLISQLKELDLEIEIFQKQNAAKFIVAKTKIIDKSKPIITLSGHTDTVISANEMPVYTEGNKLFGSGTQDMKGGVFVILETLKKLKSINNLQNIIVSISPEEEYATPNYHDVITSVALQSDYVFVYESTLDSLQDAPSDSRSVVTARRGIFMFNLIFKSAGGHSGVNAEEHQRKSTNLLASEFTLRLEKLADYQKGTTLNTGVIKGGTSFNTIAGETKIECETRYKTFDEFERVKSDIAKLVEEFNTREGFDLAFEEVMIFPPLPETEANKETLLIMHEAAQEINIVLIEEKRGSGSEACIYKLFNPQAIVLDGFGVRGDRCHTKDEFLFIDSVQQAVDFSSQVIKKIIKNS